MIKIRADLRMELAVEANMALAVTAENNKNDKMMAFGAATGRTAILDINKRIRM